MLQKINLDTLKTLRAFCLEHGVKFFLDAGTLLGAVRHKGFIPWDDDIDIAMTRENFNKFNDLCKNKELPNPLIYATPIMQGEKKYFLDFVPRIFNTSVIIRKEKKYDLMYGGYFKYPHIDIFIIDEVDDDKIKKAQFKQKYVFGLGMAHRYDLDYDKYSLIEKAQVKTLSSIGALYSMQDICSMQLNYATKYNTKTNHMAFYSNYEAAWQYMYLKKSWIKDYIETPFEDTVMPIPNGYDNILKLLYNDYMKLPPFEKQKPSHIEMF